MDDIRFKPGDKIELPDGPLEILDKEKNPILGLRDFERVAVKESIQAVGVQVPVIVSLRPTRGKIIDGFHRLELCQELGMSCPITFKEYASEEAEEKAQLALNLQRRQLDDLSAGLINIRLLEMYGITGRGRKSLSGLTISDVAREAGQSERTFFRRVEMARLLSRPDCVDIREAYRKEEISATEAMTLARARKKEADGGSAPTMPRKGETLRDVVHQLKKNGQISPLEQARMEAFTEGVKWGWDATNDKPADPDWVLQQLTDWREATYQREHQEQQERQAAAAS